MRSDGTGKGRAEAGFTLIELMISSVILAGVLFMAGALLNRGQILLSTTSIRSEAEVKAAQVAMQVAERMRNGVLSTLEDGAGNPVADGSTVTNGVHVREYLRWEGGPVFGKTLGIVVLDAEAVDGLDNDNDNVVDEKTVRAVEWAAAPAGPATDLGTIGEKVQRVDVTRVGNQLRVDVFVLRYDPNIREERAYRGTTHVTLKN